LPLAEPKDPDFAAIVPGASAGEENA